MQNMINRVVEMVVGTCSRTFETIYDGSLGRFWPRYLIPKTADEDPTVGKFEEAHRDLLLQGRDVWNRWRQQNLLVTGQLSLLDLSGEDLSGYDLHKCNLNGVNFQGANLTNVNFSESSLMYADFRQANLLEVDFSHATLLCANFDGLTIADVVFDGANLSSARMHDFTAYRSKFTGASLYGTNIFWATFQNCRFVNTTIEQCKLSCATFITSECQGTKFTDTTIVFCTFNSCNFTDTKIKGTVFSSCRLIHLRFDASHPVLHDHSETARTKYIVHWGHLRFMGQLPLFSASYIALAAGVAVTNLVHYFNRFLDGLERKINAMTLTASGQEKIAFLNGQEVLDYRMTVPLSVQLATIASLFLAIGVVTFKTCCPERVREFSETRWVDELARPRLLYLADAWRSLWLAYLSLIFTLIGAGIAGWLFLGQALIACQELLKLIEAK